MARSFIVANNLEFRKSHELLELLGICKAKDPELSAIEDDCNFLNRFYLDTRYPVHWPSDYKKEDALKASSAAKRIADAISSSLFEFL